MALTLWKSPSWGRAENSFGELQFTIIFIATEAVNTLDKGKNTPYFDLIRHKYRQHPRVAIHMMPRDLAAGEEAYQGDVTQGFADDL
jgi:hypothetical protein